MSSKNFQLHIYCFVVDFTLFPVDSSCWLNLTLKLQFADIAVKDFVVSGKGGAADTLLKTEDRKPPYIEPVSYTHLTLPTNREV